MDLLKAVVLTLEGVLQTVGLRVGAEQPDYRTLQRDGSLELREYGPRLVAETLVTGDAEAARNAGFRRVAAYIFGANQGREQVAMTAPVTQAGGQAIAMTAPVVQTPDSASAAAWRIQFIMPAQYRSIDALPKPNDPAVRLREEMGGRYAVRRFSGSRAPSAVTRQTDVLLGDVARKGWRPRGAPVAWFYDPPWTLPMARRNEVAVPVE